MKPTYIIFFTTFILITSFSCNKNKDEGDFIIKGKIINAGSKEPIDSVLVILYGGNPMSNPFMPGFNDNPPNGNNDTTYTDKNGEFKLEIHNEKAAFIGWVKDGYVNTKIYENGQETTNKFFTPCNTYVTLEYEAKCSFFPVFMKKINNINNDTLIVYISRYDFQKRFIPYRTYYGKSPFTLDSDFGYCTGNTYFHYKIEYTDNGIWKTKIDSLYVKSFETYNDTIYY